MAKHQRDLGVLLEQQKLHDAAAEAEERIRRAFATYADGLSNLTVQAKHALLERLKVKVVARNERVLVTAEIDPALFTIEHTLGSTPNWRYTIPVKTAPIRRKKLGRGRPRAE